MNKTNHTDKQQESDGQDFDMQDIDQLAQSLPSASPSAELDQRILSLAADQADKNLPPKNAGKPSSKFRLGLDSPMAMAAVVLLSASLIWLASPQLIDHETTSERTNGFVLDDAVTEKPRSRGAENVVSQSEQNQTIAKYEQTLGASANQVLSADESRKHASPLMADRRTEQLESDAIPLLEEAEGVGAMESHIAKSRAVAEDTLSASPKVSTIASTKSQAFPKYIELIETALADNALHSARQHYAKLLAAYPTLITGNFFSKHELDQLESQ